MNSNYKAINGSKLNRAERRVRAILNETTNNDNCSDSAMAASLLMLLNRYYGISLLKTPIEYRDAIYKFTGHWFTR